MKADSRLRRFLFSLRSYAAFFLLMSFVITCCMVLFLKTLQQTLGISFTEANIRSAAVATFGNVLFLSLLCTVIDGVRRKFMVERPVRRIVASIRSSTISTAWRRSSPA